MKKITKIIIAIMAIIIVAGIVVVATSGFNVDIRYKKAQKIELYLQKEFEISDIKNILKEVMPNKQVVTQKVEAFGDTVSITAEEITDEEKQAIVEKVNEKYEIELKADSVTTLEVPQTKLINVVMPYILPYILTTAIILIYMAIRYYKLNSIKIILKEGITLVAVEATLLSLVAITRIPFSRYVMPASILVYTITLVCTTSKFEKQLKQKIEESKENKKA